MTARYFHAHQDTNVLTFGCEGCIERVRMDQIVATIIDQDVTGDDLPWPTDQLVRQVYRYLRRVRGDSRESARFTIDQWYQDCSEGWL